MSSARFLVGDVFDRLAEIPDGSVDLVLTSPPFLALRSYLPAGHPDKAKEIGSEPTPAEFIDTLLALTAEWRRVLAPHGSICVELGDTYAGSGGAGGDYGDGGMRDGQPKFRQRTDGGRYPNGYSGNRTGNDVSGSNPGFDVRPVRGQSGWPLDKSLTGIPTLYAWSLAYGRNLLTGEPSPAGQWRIRNVVAWVRPNPPVGALGDKFRPGTSYMTVATIARDRYFDLDAVRGPASPNTHARTAKGVDKRQSTGKTADDERRGGNWSTLDTLHDTAGAPPLDWWNIPTQGYKGAHYATWPEALCTRPILAMCPRRVCTTCGEPSRRAIAREYVRDERGGTSGARRDLTEPDGRTNGTGMTSKPVMAVQAETLGWSDCGHGTWRPGHVLDPFAGSGTTLAVAVGHGRNATGVDLDERNAHLAQERVGMFLTVDHPTAKETA